MTNNFNHFSAHAFAINGNRGDATRKSTPIRKYSRRALQPQRLTLGGPTGGGSVAWSGAGACAAPQPTIPSISDGGAFRRSVLRCINADLCNQRFIFQRVSRSTRFSHFCTARKSKYCKIFRQSDENLIKILRNSSTI